MLQRGVSYYDIWKIVDKYFPVYVEKNILEGCDDQTILCRSNPFDYLNRNHFIRSVIIDLQRKGIFDYDDFDEKLWALLNDLIACDNWRTDSLFKYLINSLFSPIRDSYAYDIYQKFIKNHQLSNYEEVFMLHDYHEYTFDKRYSIDYFDLNMFFLQYYPEYASYYKKFAMQYYGDDTNSDFIYYGIFRLIFQQSDHDFEYKRFIDFLSDLKKVPTSDGISPLGMMMYGCNGVVLKLFMEHIISEDEKNMIYHLLGIEERISYKR